jgi:hypothetical protein
MDLYTWDYCMVFRIGSEEYDLPPFPIHPYHLIHCSMLLGCLYGQSNK